MSDPIVLLALVYVAGICLIYADNLPTRLGGTLLSLAALLGASGPSTDPDNFYVQLLWIGLAVACLAIFRPQWLRDMREYQETRVP
jgi:hypothetical protein